MTGATPGERATAELEERHPNHLLFADRQRMKAGEHDAVAKDLRRRTTLTLWACGAMALLLLSSGMWFAALVVICAAAVDVHRARRTHETIVQLRRSAGISATRDHDVNTHDDDRLRERLRFSEKQLFDAGDYALVTSGLRTRARTRAIVGMAFAVLIAVFGMNNEAREDQISGLIAFAVITVACLVDHWRTEQLVAEIEATPSAA